MERIRSIILMAVMALAFQLSHAQQAFSDKAQYGRYAKANAELKESPRAVFMGNSITEGWVAGSPGFWKEHPEFAGRGISRQTTL